MVGWLEIPTMLPEIAGMMGKAQIKHVKGQKLQFRPDGPTLTIYPNIPQAWEENSNELLNW